MVEMVGLKFGLLTVLREAGRKHKWKHWECACDCGRVATVAGVYLRNGHTKSCGCKRGDRPISHGAARRSGREPEYGVWAGMRRRCSDPKSRQYSDYGGRGITVCSRWEEYAAFIADMGKRPSDAHTIERVDNNAGYSPENCIWATRDVQATNRRPRHRTDVCAKGHDLDGANLYIRPDGKRGCRACRRQNMTDYYARKKEGDAHGIA